MAAGMTPGEAGILVEPLELVVEWARVNYYRQRFDEPEIAYTEFKESQLTEGR